MKPAAFLLAVASVLASTGALAEPDADAEADRLFKEGRALMVEGDFAQACPKLEKSQRLSPHGGTLLNLAACHERLGKLAAAWVEFHDALTAANAEGKEDRARLARERIEALDPRISWVMIAVPAGADPSKITVLLDDANIQPLAWNKEMPVDAGPHRVVVIRGTSVEQPFSIQEGEHKKIVLDDAPSPPSPTPPPSPPPIPPPPTLPPSLGAGDHPRGAIVVELGLFAGFMNDNFANGTASASPGDITLQGTNNSSTCADVSCAFGLQAYHARIIGGGTGFLGIAATERFHVGLRGIGAIGEGPSVMLAVGPSISGRVWGPIWAGWSFYTGVAGVTDTGEVSASGYAALSRPRVTQSTGLTVGNDIELDLAVLNFKSGSLMAGLHPTFLVGGRDIAIVIPVSLSYRFY